MHTAMVSRSGRGHGYGEHTSDLAKDGRGADGGELLAQAKGDVGQLLTHGRRRGWLAVGARQHWHLCRAGPPKRVRKGIGLHGREEATQGEATQGEATQGEATQEEATQEEAPV